MKLRLAIVGTVIGAALVVAGIYLALGLWAALILAGGALVAFCLTVNA